MQLANIELWWLIPAVALLCAALLRSDRRREQRLTSLADAGLLPQLIDGFEELRTLRRREAYLVALAALLVAAALLRPQWGFTWKPTQKRGVDIMVAVDVSESMLAEDIRPNRLTRARRELQDLLEGLQGDRVGLVAFAGSAFVECPLTLDYGAFRLFLNELSPELIPIRGTNIEAAILESVSAFKRAAGQASGSETPARDRALLLITDGEDFEGDFAAAARLANENKVRIYILGIGTPEGAPIPTARGYKKDRAGKIVLTRLNQASLEELAKQTGGVYVTSISSNRDIDALYRFGIKEQLAAAALEWARGRIWNEYFQLPLLLAVLCLTAVELLRARNARRRTEAIDTRAEVLVEQPMRQLLSVLLLAAAAIAPPPAAAQSAEALGARAKAAFERGDFSTALKEFSDAAARQEEDYRFKIGQGATQYRLGDFASALGSFLEADKMTEDAAARAQALYNAGNSMVQLNQLEDAIKTYQEVLKLAPEDREAKDNLEYAKKLLEQQRRQKQQKDKQQQNQQQQQQQQQQQERQEQQEQEQQQSGGGQGQEQSQEEQQSGARQEQQPQQGQQQEKDPRDEQQDAAGKEPEQEEPQGGAAGEKDKQDARDSEQQPQSSQEEDNKQRERQEERPAGGKGGEQEQQKQAGGEGSESEERSKDQLEAQLDTLQEGTSRRMKARLQRGVKQLEELERRVPEKDW